MNADEPVLNAAFTSVSTDKITWSSEIRDRIQGKDLPAVGEDQARDLLRNFDP